MLFLQTAALKEARKKWEEELRSQMIENEREMKRIRIASRQEQEPVDQTVTQLVSLFYFRNCDCKPNE